MERRNDRMNDIEKSETVEERVSLETSSIYNRPFASCTKNENEYALASLSAMSYRRIELRDSKQPASFIEARTTSTNPRN